MGHAKITEDMAVYFSGFLLPTMPLGFRNAVPPHDDADEWDVRLQQAARSRTQSLFG